MNVVNGVSQSYKTANIVFSFDSVEWPANWSVYIGLRDAIRRQFIHIENSLVINLPGTWNS